MSRHPRLSLARSFLFFSFSFSLGLYASFIRSRYPGMIAMCVYSRARRSSRRRIRLDHRWPWSRGLSRWSSWKGNCIIYVRAVYCGALCGYGFTDMPSLFRERASGRRCARRASSRSPPSVNYSKGSEIVSGDGNETPRISLQRW